MRASSDGTATPVTVVVMITSTSLGCRPASSSAPDNAAQPSSTACSMKRSLVSPKSPSVRYCSIGRMRCRLSTFALACRPRTTCSYPAKPGAATKVSVISSWL